MGGISKTFKKAFGQILGAPDAPTDQVTSPTVTSVVAGEEDSSVAVNEGGDEGTGISTGKKKKKVGTQGARIPKASAPQTSGVQI